MVNRPTVVDVPPKWLTQTHIDYLVSKQELYGEDAVLTETMKKLLAKLLTTKLWDSQYVTCSPLFPYAREARTSAATNAIVQVQSRQVKEPAPRHARARANAAPHARSVAPLVDHFRISASSHASQMMQRDSLGEAVNDARQAALLQSRPRAAVAHRCGTALSKVLPTTILCRGRSPIGSRTEGA